MLVAASSTAWTRSSRQAGGASPECATVRTSSRMSTSRSRSASTVIAFTTDRRSAHPGVIGRRPLDEPAIALSPRELTVADDDRAARQDDVAAALDGSALVAGVVDVHVMGGRGDRVSPVRVVDDDVGVGPDRDRALLREHPEHLRGRGRDDLDPAFARDAATDDAPVVEKVDAVLDPGQAVRDLPEVVPSELLLPVEVERAVVGRNELEVVLDETRPQVVPGLLCPQGRGADELRALEAVAHVVEGEEQVLRARLGERLRAA